MDSSATRSSPADRLVSPRRAGSRVADPHMDGQAVMSSVARSALAAAATRVENDLPQDLTQAGLQKSSDHLRWLQSAAFDEAISPAHSETGATHVLRRQLLAQMRSAVIE